MDISENKFDNSILIRKADEKEFIKDMSQRENALFIVAQHKDKIIGNLSFSGSSTNRTAHAGEFGVSVLKQYWGNGVGEKLIKYLIYLYLWVF